MAWVVFGAIWTRGRPGWSTFHVLALIWGIIAEVGPWPCPLTLAEQWTMTHAAMHGFRGGFIEHCLSKLVCPKLPTNLIVTGAVVVCSLNLGVYAWRLRRWFRVRTIKEV